MNTTVLSTRAAIARAGLLAITFALAASCEAPPAAPDAGSPRCIPGMSAACACDDGRSGAQSCLADGTYGACTCADPDAAAGDASVDVSLDRATADGPGLDADDGADAPATDARDVPMDTGPTDAGLDAPTDRSVPDASLDARPADAALDASPDARPVDAAPDVAPDAGPDAGCAVTACDLRPPWSSGGCTLWTRVPPEYDYLPPVATSEGMFAVATNGAAMLRTTTGWRMSVLPSPIDALRPGTGWLAAVRHHSGFGRVFLRRGGRWEPSGSFTRVTHSWATGASLFVWADDSLREFDGASWRTIAGIPSGPGYGDRTGLYVVDEATHTLRYYDGARVVGVPTETPGEIRAVGGLSGSEVYVIGAHLYRAVGATLRREPDVDCGGPAPRYERFITAPGRLLLVATCGAESRAWSRVGAAWAPLGVAPGALAVSENGDLYAASHADLWSRVGGAWVPVPVESPAVPGGVVAALSSTDAWSVGAGGVARLAGDTWTTAATPDALATPLSAWAAPDGTLFVTAEWGATSTAWRYAGGRWTAGVTGTSFSPLTGRSASDVWFASGLGAERHVHHWNGSSWETLPGPPCIQGGASFVSRIALAGPRTTLALCRSAAGTLNGDAVYQTDDGRAWTMVMHVVTGIRDLYQLGPVTSPSVVVVAQSATPGVYDLQIRNASGWAAWSYPDPFATFSPYPSPILRGSLPGSIVVSSDGYAAYDGARRYVADDWIARQASGGDTGTDQRWAIASTRTQVIRCALHP